MKFTPDDGVRMIAEAYALDARDFVRTQFHITLDGSDASIQHIERVMDAFQREIATAKPSEEQIMGFAKMFGSYLGEVFRKNHGAAWGVAEMNGERVAGLKATTGDKVFWPWGRARSRLVEGAEHNVWHYYSALIR
ncbi:MAG: hypothetical protein NTV51_11640 [Verrucomicrobia bacterium]|nr:hypothetical protein [Verrucomicrobiota bacterium]